MLPTALGHTLLHIACLPPSTRYFKRSLATLRSIHDTRCLQIPRTRRLVPTPLPGSFPNYNMSGNVEEKEARSYFQGQTNLLKFLVSEQNQNVGEQDIYGNTALHYLAGHRVVNTEALDFLRAADGGEAAWSEKRNRWGYTAKGIMEDEEIPLGKEGDGLLEKPLRENLKEARRLIRGVDEWRDEKLAVEWRKGQREEDREEEGHHHGCECIESGNRGGRGGRGSSRGGRCGECGRRIKPRIDEFPYHVRRAAGGS